MFTGGNILVFSGSDRLMCLQEVMFCHVYRWRYFGVFMTVMFCLPVKILCCVYRQQCFFCVYRRWYFGVFTGSDCQMCL